MKKIAAVLLVILLVSFCFGTTVYLRKGGTIEGEVISKDDEKFIIKTEEGEKTIKWRSVKNKSIEEIYPELYEALKAQAIERKKKKEEANGIKKNIKKKEIDFSSISLDVETSESGGTFKKKGFDKSLKVYQKEKHGIISISLSGLNPKKDYTVKTVYSYYLKPDNKDNMSLEKTPGWKNIVKEEKIFGKSKYAIEIITSPYYSYKISAKSGYFIKKSRGRYLTKVKYGHKADGWDVSVWLNGTLVYEKKKGKNAIYYNNISH